MPNQKTWNVYIIRCNDGTLYTGITTDLARRISEHNGLTPKTGKDRGAAYTRARRPVVLVYCEPFPDRSSASRRESQVKRLSRAAKQALIANTTLTLSPIP